MSENSGNNADRLVLLLPRDMVSVRLREVCLPHAKRHHVKLQTKYYMKARMKADRIAAGRERLKRLAFWLREIADELDVILDNKSDSNLLVAKISKRKMLMTITEVMEVTGFCRTTLWRKCSCGEMPAPIGSPKRFRRSDIEYWVENGMKSATTTRALKAAESNRSTAPRSTPPTPASERRR